VENEHDMAVAPIPGATMATLGTVQIPTMVAGPDIVIAGVFRGEIVAKNTQTHVIEYNKRITHDEDAITNPIDL
jgi:hypothetical protein